MITVVTLIYLGLVGTYLSVGYRSYLHLEALKAKRFSLCKHCNMYEDRDGLMQVDPCRGCMTGEHRKEA